MVGIDQSLPADRYQPLLPDRDHSQYCNDAGEREDEAREPVQGSLIDLSEGGDVRQAGKLQSYLHVGESGT